LIADIYVGYPRSIVPWVMSAAASTIDSVNQKELVFDVAMGMRVGVRSKNPIEESILHLPFGIMKKVVRKGSNSFFPLLKVNSHVGFDWSRWKMSTGPRHSVTP